MRTTIFRMRSAGFLHTWELGLGPAFVKVSGLHFSTDYQDTSGNAQAYDPPLSFYNSRQDVDLSDRVLAGHLHAGADYGLNAKTLLGLKLTYSMMGDIESTGGYSLHPFHERDPDFTNRNTFTDPHHWTLSFYSQIPVRQLNCFTRDHPEHIHPAHRRRAPSPPGSAPNWR